MRAVAIGLTAGVLAAACAGPTATAPRPGQTLRDCADCPEMVVVPPGAFKMGSDHVERMRGNEMRPEGPVRDVRIGYAFAVGKYEVTNKEFGAFVAATGYRPADACQVWGGIDTVAGKTWREPDYGRPPRDDEPVVCVSWRDAKAYTAWLSQITGKSYRLLTEAEWEYAAKAGAATTWPWGEDAQKICEYANVFDATGRADPRQTNDGGAAGAEQAECSDGYAIVAPVGRFKPNAFGLYDMIGNVWEWTEDCSAPGLYPAAPVDGSAVQAAGPCDKRAVRSASWRTRLSRQRPSFRGRDPEPTASNIFGFRVARDLN
jgi:formylglycine-generating enzyme required for sulfatase activity